MRDRENSEFREIREFSDDTTEYLPKRPLFFDKREFKKREVRETAAYFAYVRSSRTSVTQKSPSFHNQKIGLNGQKSHNKRNF